MTARKSNRKRKAQLTIEDEFNSIVDDSFKLEIFAYVERNQENFSFEPLEFIKLLLATHDQILPLFKDTNPITYKDYEYLKSIPFLLKTELEINYFGTKLIEAIEKYGKVSHNLELLQKETQNALELLQKESQNAQEILNSDISSFEKEIRLNEILNKFINFPDFPDEKLKNYRLICILKLELMLEKLRRETEVEPKDEKLDEKLDSKLGKRQWIIAMRFFINHFKLRNVDSINFARLLTVLNGGKNLQDFRTNLNNERGLITAKTVEKAQDIADLFREFGLPEIAGDIEEEISKVKTKNL